MEERKARLQFKDRVRELTRRNNPLSMYQVIHELSLYLRGWVGYFGIQEFKYLFRDLDAWIRSRLRSTQLKKWKNPRKFQRIMIKAGFDPKEAHRVWLKMDRWQSVMRRPVLTVLEGGGSLRATSYQIAIIPQTSSFRPFGDLRFEDRRFYLS